MGFVSMFPLHVVLLAFSLLRRQSTLRWCYAAVTSMKGMLFRTGDYRGVVRVHYVPWCLFL